jgi:hypothetical protein
MHSMALTFGLIAVGVVMILLGNYMAIIDWKRKLKGKPEAERNALGGTLQGRAKYEAALKGYPLGALLVILGTGVISIGGCVAELAIHRAL